MLGITYCGESALSGPAASSLRRSLCVRVGIGGQGYGNSHADCMSWGWGRDWPVSWDPVCRRALRLSPRSWLGPRDWQWCQIVSILGHLALGKTMVRQPKPWPSHAGRGSTHTVRCSARCYAGTFVRPGQRCARADQRCQRREGQLRPSRTRMG